LIPYLLGEPHPLGKKLANYQKCFRAEDIEEVGDNRHITFFEMLGNWSLGSYFKTEQLTWFFEFLTQIVGLDPQKLYVTVFAGDESLHIPKDVESAAVWKELFKSSGIEARDIYLGTKEQGSESGMQGGRIFYYDAQKNWWSRSGVPAKMPPNELGGPDSEVFYDFGSEHNPQFGKYCHPNCDCGRFLEIGNSVFMEYKKLPNGSFEKLQQRNVDFGGGLERISAAANNDPDIFKVDSLSLIVRKLEELSGLNYGGSRQKSFRIIADHIRGAAFMIADGVEPANTDRGYFVRRLIRRAVRQADVLGIKPGRLVFLVESIVKSQGEVYPELIDRSAAIAEVIKAEEEKFRTTLERGLKEFEKISSAVNRKPASERVEGIIDGRSAFNLYQTYGFPLEMMVDLAKERGLGVDIEGFKKELEKHQQMSRTATAGRFKGGLADTQEETVRLHTAHHLLLAALQRVLGPHVKQRGSNITAERLRLDFLHPRKMTAQEIEAVEKLVNQKIKEGLKMVRLEMPKEEAEKIGAEMEFGAKYGEIVSVYLAQDDKGNIFSKEFCGGPHVQNTRELGHFKIIKEEAVAAGIRRIKAVLQKAED
jgi:alanyl-tRNA synthetase